MLSSKAEGSGWKPPAREPPGHLYLGLLVVFVLDAVDLLKQVAHPVNLGDNTTVGVTAALFLLVYDHLPSLPLSNVHVTPRAPPYSDMKKLTETNIAKDSWEE